MKKLLLILGLTLALNVNAEVWVQPNESGGEITLTDKVCEVQGKVYNNLRKAYAWSNKNYVEGCWGILDGNVHAMWIYADGTTGRKVYPISSFTRRQ